MPSRSGASPRPLNPGSDFELDQLVSLRPPCHAQTDAPYARGRLVLTPLGGGRFTCEVIRGADKWVVQA